jgi:cob(I)alamin adenosyltransferase
MTVNLTRIYTKLGDGGETHLGDMSRVPKTHVRIEAYGAVDELNAQLGVTLTLPDLPEQQATWLRRVQNDLFDVGADLAVPHGGDRERLRVDEAYTTWLEGACDEVNARSCATSTGSPTCCSSSAGRPTAARSRCGSRGRRRRASWV